MAVCSGITSIPSPTEKLSAPGEISHFRLGRMSSQAL
jgi:hypothetical protein